VQQHFTQLMLQHQQQQQVCSKVTSSKVRSKVYLTQLMVQHQQQQQVCSKVTSSKVRGRMDLQQCKLVVKGKVYLTQLMVQHQQQLDLQQQQRGPNEADAQAPQHHQQQQVCSKILVVKYV